MTGLRMSGPLLDHWLAQLVLDEGTHDTPDEGMCALEAVAWLTGGRHTAAPDCVDPLLRVLVGPWQDGLPHSDRQQLVKPLLLDLVGTTPSGPRAGATRAAMAWELSDWFTREAAPAALRLAGMTGDADRLAGLDPVGPDTVEAATAVVAPICDRATGWVRQTSLTDAAREVTWQDLHRSGTWAAYGAATWARGGRGGMAYGHPTSRTPYVPDPACHALAQVAWGVTKTATELAAHAHVTSSTPGDLPGLAGRAAAMADLLRRLCTVATSNPGERGPRAPRL